MNTDINKSEIFFFFMVLQTSCVPTPVMCFHGILQYFVIIPDTLCSLYSEKARDWSLSTCLIWTLGKKKTCQWMGEKRQKLFPLIFIPLSGSFLEISILSSPSRLCSYWGNHHPCLTSPWEKKKQKIITHAWTPSLADLSTVFHKF